MKLRNPKNKFDLKIGRRDKVVETGGGHNPHPRSNVLVDKYAISNEHRCGDLKVLKNQTFIEADGTDMPFKDKEFDYALCIHVLEHVEDPEPFLKEQFRIAKRGYLETPSLIGEYLFPRESHKWILQEIDNVLYLVEKSKINFRVGYDMGHLIQDYLPMNSIGFKILERTHPNLMSVRIEWQDDFKFVINPTDPEILKFFSGQWEMAWAERFFPKKTLSQEFFDSAAAFWDITKSVFKSKFLKKAV